MSQPRSAQLDGVRVLVTRPRHQAEDLCRRLAALGADVLVQPAIRITEPPDWAPVDAALDHLEAYDWLVFSSGNGVHFLLDRLRARHGGLDKLYAVKLAAIGPGTADELARYGLDVDLVPDEYRAEALAAALVGEAPGRRLLLARASRGRAVLAEDTCRRRLPGGRSRRLLQHGRRARRPGNSTPGGPACRGANRLDHRNQFGDCPVAGEALRRELASRETGEHQPGHVGDAPRVGL